MTRNKLHDPPSVKSQYIGRDPIIRVGSGLAGLVGVGAMAGAPMVGVGSGQKNTGPGWELPWTGTEAAKGIKQPHAAARSVPTTTAPRKN